jgi:hypothetical protein
MKRLKYQKKLIFLLTLFLTACGGGGGSNLSDNNDLNSSITEENQKPRVYAGEDRKAQINVSLTIWGSAIDPDGVISSYEWKKGDEVLSSTAIVSYIPTQLGTDKLTLTVMDNDGAVASDSININVVEYEVKDTYNDPLPF